MPSTPRRLRRLVAGLSCAAMLVTGTGIVTATAAQAAEPEVMCPADAGNARFVRWIYLNILFRCPDEAGLAYWTAQIDNGLPRDVVAGIVDMSDENLITNNVLHLYGAEGILQRDPTDLEVAHGVDSILTYQSDGPLIAELLSSDEFYDSNLSDVPADERDDAWLNSAFNRILDRDPDPGGRAYFRAVLGEQSTAATRSAVALFLELSDENADSWVGAAMGGALHRAPDAGGFDFWKSWLTSDGAWQTFRMWSLLLSSPEAYSLAQSQPNP